MAMCIKFRNLLGELHGNVLMPSNGDIYTKFLDGAEVDLRRHMNGNRSKSSRTNPEDMFEIVLQCALS